jgi:hypothetical protein
MTAHGRREQELERTGELRERARGQEEDKGKRMTRART